MKSFDEEARSPFAFITVFMLGVRNQGVYGEGKKQGYDKRYQPTLDADHHFTEEPGYEICCNGTDLSHLSNLHFNIYTEHSLHLSLQ
jgi:hypothetical protein